MKICVVIPAYNEEKRIKKVLDTYLEPLLASYGKSTRIFVVSESTDKTNRIVEGYAKRHKQVVLLSNNEKLGKGGAIASGFLKACKSSNFDILGFVDSDTSVPFEEIEKLIRVTGKWGIDGAIASRYTDGSKIIGKTNYARFLASRCYNLLVRLLFGFPYADTQCGAKFFKARSICGIMPALTLADFSFDINLLYVMQKRHYKIAEVPIRYLLTFEGSKINVRKHALRMFTVAIGFRIANSPLKILLPRSFSMRIYKASR